MGTIGVENNRNTAKSSSTADVNGVVTRIIDAECHRLAQGDGLQDEEDGDCIHLSSTMPTDNDYLLEDAFETQLVNITGGTQLIDYAAGTQVMDYAGETQVMDYAGETQAMDLSGETQVMDYAGEAQVMDLSGETQVMDYAGEAQVMDLCETQVMDYAGNETQKIDCYDETQALGDVGCVKNTSSDCLDKPNSRDDDATKMLDDVSGTSPVTVSNEDHSGSACRDFTSIRAASFRASGLAARARGANRTLFCTNTGKSSLEQQASTRGSSSIVGRLLQYGTKNVEDSRQNKNSEGNDKPETASNYKFRNTVVRKLFLDDQVTECVQSEADVNLNYRRDDNQVDSQTSYLNHFEGLSYANSQEPGELSQAEALKVVDKFLNVNVENNNDFFGFRVDKAEKPKAVSAAKGSRDLAKVSISKRINGQKGIYDWDDNSEDECGGELFLKKKEIFFDCEGPKRRILPEARDRKGMKRVKNVAAHENEEKHTTEKLTDGFDSDSMLMSRKLRATRKTLHSEEESLPEILSKEFDQDLKTASVHHLTDNDSNNKEITAQIETIGPDTQIAAEAMEILCVEVELAGNDNIAAHNKGTCSTAKATSKSRSTTKECSTVEGQSYPSTGAVTRLGKRRNTVGFRSSNEYCAPSETSKNARKRSRRKLGSVRKDKRAKVDVITCHEVEPTVQMSERKPHLDKQPIFSSPVASRTRNRSQNSCSKAICDLANGKEEFNDMISGRVPRKQRTSAIYNIESNTVKKVRKFGSRASDVDASEQLETSPQERCKTSALNCNTPPTCAAPMNDVSPICMGDEYHKQSCKSNLSRPSLVKEISNLVVNKTLKNYPRTKDLRKRKDIGNIRVLFSQHLDDDIVKQQQKILARLGGTVASSILDATHFVADEFVRTRNMLEAIALGKSVVTHLWLDSCGQASCLIDEKNYILRDAKKEKEFGFSLPGSLSRARQHPLLQGYKVFITPNTKPGKDILAKLVKAVHGLVVEILSRSVSNDEKHPDDLLVLSCEDDYDICIPFLKKGGSVYSSELLLNGIVKQKLEHQRHLLFADNVKRTCSTVWLKSNNQYLPAK